MCVCVHVSTFICIHIVIVLYNVCGIIDTLLLLLTVMYCNYSLSSSTLVSLINPSPTLDPPNTIIQLVVGVTLHTEKECQYLSMTVSGILNYYKNNN